MSPISRILHLDYENTICTYIYVYTAFAFYLGLFTSLCLGLVSFRNKRIQVHSVLMF